MDSQEILSAIEEATTSESIPKETLTSESRVGLVYNDDSPFDQPVVIRGTNKQFTPFENLVSFNDNECSVDEVVTMCKNVDSNLRIETIEDISDVEMTFVDNSYIVLEDNNPTKENTESSKYYVFSTNSGDSKKENVAFRRWSEILKVPYSYSKKNPGFVNEVNFEYWKKFLTVAKDQQIPVDIIYLKDTIEIPLPTVEGDTENIEEFVNAHVIVNILKSEVVYEKKTVVEVIHSELTDRIPMMSSVLDNVQSQISEINPSYEVNIQQYSLGYTGTNKGNHYARLVLGNTGAEFYVEDQKMVPTISVESDFIGRSDDFGFVNVSFGLMREVCSNGLMIGWNEKQKEGLREQFVLNYLSNRGIEEGSEEYMGVFNEATSNFNTIFSSSGIKIPVNIANSAFAGALFNQIFKFFLSSVCCMQASIEELSVDFGLVDEKEFVSAVHNVGGSMKINNDLIKYLIIEYIAGTFANQAQTFQTPLDVVNFLTFLCRSYDSEVQLEVERKAYAFAYMLMQILILKQRSDNSVYESYFRKINGNNIAN